MSTKIICTREEAIKEIYTQRKLKRVRYCVFIRPFLPTQENRGFEGCALVEITRKEFIRAINRVLENFEDRGAKLELTIPTKDYESFCI